MGRQTLVRILLTVCCLPTFFSHAPGQGLQRQAAPPARQPGKADPPWVHRLGGGLLHTAWPLNHMVVAHKSLKIYSTHPRASRTSTSGEIRCFDLRTRTPAFSVPSKSYHSCIGISADDKWIALGDFEGHITILDASSGEQLMASHFHDAKVTAVAFGPERKTLVSCSQDRVVIWDCARKQVTQTIRHTDSIDWMKVCPRTHSLICGSANKKPRLYELASGKPLAWAPAPAGDYGNLILSSFVEDGSSLLYVGADGALHGWSISSGKHTIHCHPPRNNRLVSCSVDSEAKRLALLYHDGSVETADLTRKPWTFTPFPHRSVDGGGRCYLAGRYLLISTDWAIVPWDLQAGKVAAGFPSDGHVLPVLCTQAVRGERLVSIALYENIIWWDLQSFREIHRAPLPPRLRAPFAVSPDGKKYAALRADGKVALGDPWTGKILEEVSLGTSSITAMAFLPGGSRLLTADKTYTARVWDLSSKSAGSEVSFASRREESGQKYDMLAVSNDGTMLAITTLTHLKVYQLSQSKRPIVTLDLLGKGVVNAVAFSPDGNTIAVLYGYDRSTLVLYDSASLTEKLRFDGRTDCDQYTLAFTPDGRYLVAGSADTSVILYDLPQIVLRGQKLDPSSLPAAWEDLLSDEAPSAYRATWMMASSPHLALPFLEQQTLVCGKSLERAISRILPLLDNDSFEIRQKASSQLEQMGPAIYPLLDRHLAQNLPVETRGRLASLAKALNPNIRAAHERRVLHVIEILEMIHDDRSRKLIERLAQQDYHPRIQAAARTALTRCRASPARPMQAP